MRYRFTSLFKAAIHPDTVTNVFGLPLLLAHHFHQRVEPFPLAIGPDHAHYHVWPGYRGCPINGVSGALFESTWDAGNWGIVVVFWMPTPSDGPPVQVCVCMYVHALVCENVGVYLVYAVFITSDIARLWWELFMQHCHKRIHCFSIQSNSITQRKHMSTHYTCCTTLYTVIM